MTENKNAFYLLQVIATDHVPVGLYYVEHLDQVWVLCWNREEDTGYKTAIIIRQASQPQQHHTVHTQPIGNRFDLVSMLQRQNSYCCFPLHCSVNIRSDVNVCDIIVQIVNSLPCRQKKYILNDMTKRPISVYHVD